MRLFALIALLTNAAGAQQYRAYWADAFHNGFKNPSQVEQMLDDAVRSRANAIFMQARRRGDVYYSKSIEPPAQDAAYSPSFDALDYLITRAHARGIEVHAWFVVTRLWTDAAPPRDPRHLWHSHGPNAQGDDMWMTVSANGRIGTSIDPGHPDCAQYLADLFVHAVRDYPALDGIHLDYIRYPELEDGGWGWNPRAVDRFQRLYNRTGHPAQTDSRFSDFRRAQITQLVRQVYLRSIATNPKIKVSAALISWGNGPLNDAGFRSTDAYATVYQDWRAWMEEGILDIGMPMHYFDNTRYSSYLDRWIEFNKDRQYNRASLIGLGVYLNTYDNVISQLDRALAPSAAGNRSQGVVLYSYAVPTAGTATPPSEFYQRIGDYFQADAKPPALPWKENPQRGHVMGWLRVDGGPAWLKDGATAIVESDTGAPTAIRATTDGNGFFGAVDLPPDRYRVRIERAGVELYRTAAQDIRPGAVVPFEIFLKAADFAPAIPRLETSTRSCVPGDILTLRGTNLASAHGWATNVPLPLDIGKTQLVINGEAAPLFEILPDRIEFQVPYSASTACRAMLKHDALESAPIDLPVAAANPAITGIRRIDERYVEIYATGLGAVNPPVRSGAGAPAFEPYARIVNPIRVFARASGVQIEAPVVFAGLTPYIPGRYQVNIELANPAILDLVLEVAGIRSTPFPLK